MKLIDTSVWVNYIKGVENTNTEYLHWELLNGGDQLCFCPIIIQEVLQGFRNYKAFEEFKRRFINIHLLKLSEPQASIDAANLFRTLRKNGVTIRKINDCIIANYALQYDIELIHNDRDFEQIAQFFPLRAT